MKKYIEKAFVPKNISRKFTSENCHVINEWPKECRQGGS